MRRAAVARRAVRSLAATNPCASISEAADGAVAQMRLLGADGRGVEQPALHAALREGVSDWRRSVRSSASFMATSTVPVR